MFPLVCVDLVILTIAFSQLVNGETPLLPGKHDQAQDGGFTSLTNLHINKTIAECKEQVGKTIVETLRELQAASSDDLRPRTGHEILRLVRYPPPRARSISESAEVFQLTLKSLSEELISGRQFDPLSEATFEEQLLTPTQLAVIADLSGCQDKRCAANCDDMYFHQKYRTLDGSCNNLKNPLLGAALTPLKRLLPPRYEDKFTLPVGWDEHRLYNGYRLPSARRVSVDIVSTAQVTADNIFTHMFMLWGQFLDHDLSLEPFAVAQTTFPDGIPCSETCESSGSCFPIRVEDDDPRIHNRSCMEFVRSSATCGCGAVTQREQLNILTSYIDASMIYGSSEEDAHNLRDFTNGRGLLRTSLPPVSSWKPLLPVNQGEENACELDPSRSDVPCFQAGDERANEHLGLLSMHTLWMREHNRIAKQLLTINPHWGGETIYHESRKIVGALIQYITYKHWLPKVLGETGMNMIGPYTGYNPNVDTGISNSFATAVLRFGHTTIQPILPRLDASFETIPEGDLPLHQAFFAPFRLVEEGGVDPIIRGFIALATKQVKPGEFLNRELTENLFALARDTALDLGALNIQRGRDHGLQSYNEFRRYCGLRCARTFEDFSSEIQNSEVRRKLRQVYRHPDNVDLFVGGIAEEPVTGARVGPTFMCILVDQFRRARDGDRFWFENPGVFTENQLIELYQATLARIICDNADDIHEVPPDVFLLLTNLPDGQVPCDSIPRVELKAWSQCCQGCTCNDNQLNVNLALNRPAYQSSTCHSTELGYLSAKYGCDGSRVNTCCGAKCSCALTLFEVNPWWTVDLGNVKCVNSVIFVNRGDYTGQSSHCDDFIIGLTNHFPGHYQLKLGSYTLCGQWRGKVPWGATVQLQCTPGVSGRYVIVQLPRKDYLTFGELEVYGCGV